MNKSANIFLIATVCCIFFISMCCDDAYDNGYSSGRDDGYDDGYNDALYGGDFESRFYEEVSERFYSDEFIQELVQDQINYDYVTLEDIRCDASFDDDFELLEALEKYYYRSAIYGEFVGDRSTMLLHSSDGECFDKIKKDNLDVFDSSISYILENTQYKKCECLGEL